MRKRRGKAGNSVRIIGGRWRGRRVRFPDIAGLRPTADRTRETLFNWLQTQTPDARCLDLFAGSGALGLEAASRGAGRTILVDCAPAAVRALEEAVRMLDAEQVEVVRARAADYLGRSPEPFDLVFVDPPFNESAVLADICERLAGGWLAPNAHVYVETDVRHEPAVPSGWRAMRNARSGDARGILYETSAAN